MILPIPMTLVSAVLAASAPPQGEAEASSPPAAWKMSPAGGCEAVLGTPGPGDAGLTAFIETELRDAPYYILIASNGGWTLPSAGDGAFEIGFDGAAPQARSARASLVDGIQIYLELDPALRDLAGKARSREYYSGDRRIGSIPLDNLGATLRGVEACLAELDRTTIRMEVVDAPSEDAAEEAQGPKR